MNCSYRRLNGAVKKVAVASLTVVASLAFLTSSQASSTPTSAASYSKIEIQRMVLVEAQNSRVPPALALAVARAESNFDAHAISSAGARGVMQIMPATGWGEFGVHPDELWDARLNIQIGIDFLEQLIDRYDGEWDLALSYYNGGSRVGTLPNARVLPATRNYVNTVLNFEKLYRQQASLWGDLDTGPSNSWTPARTTRRVGWVDHRLEDSDAAPTFDRDGVDSNITWTSGPNTNLNRLSGFQSEEPMEVRRMKFRHKLDDFTPRYRPSGG
jgi:hypothetical protein